MIEKLTKEQEELMAVYREKGIKAGIDTTPASDEQIKEAIAGLYEHILKDRTYTEIIITDSPKAAWEAVQEHVGCRMNYVHPYLDGHLFSYFFAYYDYMHEVLGVEYDCMEAYEALRKTLCMGNIYPLEDICIVSRKPVEIHMNDQYQYHNERGASLLYADGYSLFMLNGVYVPEWLVTTEWKDLDPMKFTEINNVEVRREFVRKLGVERLVQKVGGKVVDKTDDGMYELILIDLGGETGDWPYLKMRNPSIGVWHVEAVAEECRTVEQAIAWRNGSTLKPSQLT